MRCFEGCMSLSIKNADHRRYKETNGSKAEIVLQDMLTLWSQKSNFGYSMQKVPF
jgi:hypothetical protein